MKISLKKNDFIELVNIFGATKKYIVLQSCSIDTESERIKRVVVSSVDSREGSRISYPSSYIVSIKKLKKSDVLFYINKRNVHVIKSLMDYYLSGDNNAKV